MLLVILPDVIAGNHCMLAAPVCLPRKQMQKIRAGPTNGMEVSNASAASRSGCSTRLAEIQMRLDN